MSLKDRLADPNERFTPQEIYQLFEELAEEYGFHRDPNLPPKGSIVESTSMTVEGFEHLGVFVVRPRTNRDSAIGIPSLVDRILGSNFQPSQTTAFNANLVALARTVIISPPNFVDKVLESEDDQDLGFFIAFAKEYKAWMDERNKAAREKKSGKATSTSSPST